MLNLTDITVRLGGRTILDGATAALPPRSRVGLVGRNGAGKSTLVRVIADQLEPDGGSATMPKGSRLGYVAQETPAGEATPFDTVLAADTERESLLAEAETDLPLDRLAEVHERLNTIEAHAAPARAGRILAGLGFDEAMQRQPLSAFSGGWRMRVALAALLFSAPEVMLLDEPSNHLDLEAVMWLESFLQSCPATILVVSHERDFLNNVVDHILHLERGQLTLYPGGYDAFERQRAERQAQQASAAKRQQVEREKLADYVARNSARASTAKQAQSRAKALARMQPIAAVVDDPSLAFAFPDPDELKPPLVTMDLASVGYADTPILKRLNLRLDPDDRVALLGRNGNGKTTLARLIAAQLPAMEGEVTSSPKMKVGYFTQYQVEELDADDTPLDHMTRLMPTASQSAVRAQLGRFGFGADKATTLVGKLSGGERARLALALITRDAPHLLILDEPTNHLDVDSREALVQALNQYTGAVVLVSHDRHMLETTADRLVLVDDGTATEFDGTLDDYISLVLTGSAEPKPTKGQAKQARADAAKARDKRKELKRAAQQAETAVGRLTTERSAIDQALFAPREATGALADLNVSDLMQRRAVLEDRIASAEAEWLAASERLEAVDA